MTLILLKSIQWLVAETTFRNETVASFFAKISKTIGQYL